MILCTFTITVEPEDPLRFSVAECRSALATELADYSHLQKTPATDMIYRYPVIQVKRVKNTLMVLGIGQGAEFLFHRTQDLPILGSGAGACRIITRDSAIREELFGTSETVFLYEFQTPWLALNQQNAQKFYTLNGKPARDSFMQTLLKAQLTSLAKSLDYPIRIPVTCTAKVRFLRERVGDTVEMVFLGKFRTSLRIPDYFGIGRSVSLGYGTIKRITGSPEDTTGEP